jgi:two-component system, LytTR family, response regulator LytT
MNVLILEDEGLAAERAANLLQEYDNGIIVNTVDSVSESYTYLLNNPQPDLILADIHLSDGLSFELFRKLDVRSPVIFMTAYEQYAIDAFKVNSVDYLLKPLSQNDLNKAMRKYQSMSFDGTKKLSTAEIQRISENITEIRRKFKNRFLVKTGNTILFKNTEEIAYFFADDKLVYLVTNNGKQFIVDYKLEQLEDLLDPHIFYRINRKFIVRIESINKVKTLINSRLQVFLTPHFEQEIFISKEKMAEFKAWLDQ